MSAGPGRTFILATLSGPDTPGITSRVMKTLSEHRIEILDLGQAVIQNLLSLSVLFEAPSPTDASIVKDLLFECDQMGMQLDYKTLTEDQLPARSSNKKKSRYILTVIARKLEASVLEKVASTFVAHKLNIDTIQKISEGEFHVLEMQLSSPKRVDGVNLKKDLLKVAGDNSNLDLALQKDGPYRRSRRLVAFDMDSTLIQSEVIVEFAREMGVHQEVQEVTEAAMRGEIDFTESLEKRCQLLKGFKSSEIDKVYSRIQITPGAEELIRLIKKLGYKVALLSGGFTCIAERLKQRLGLDYCFANELEFKNGALTGNILGPVVDARRKAELLEVIAQQEGISRDQVIAIGDGANDLEMLERAGLGIAFNAKAVVKERADLSLSQSSLQPVLHILGLHHQDLIDLELSSAGS